MIIQIIIAISNRHFLDKPAQHLELAFWRKNRSAEILLLIINQQFDSQRKMSQMEQTYHHNPNYAFIC